MKNNMKKLLIAAFVSVMGVVSFGRQVLEVESKNIDKTNNEITIKYLNTFSTDNFKRNDNVKTFKVTNVTNTTSKVKNNNYIKDNYIEEFIDGWTSDNVNVRLEPNIDAEILDVYEFNTHISFVEYDEEWVKIKYKKDFAYMSKEYISKEEFVFEVYNVPEYSGFKSWMSYNLFGKSTNQYKLQQLAHTGEYGIRYVGDYACIAIGTFANTKIGQRIDLVLENGTIIKCVMADEKSDKHTNSDNMITTHSDCCSEFIVDTSRLDSNAKKRGDMSYCNEEWNSPVVQFYVYDENVLF